jgi:hypothetical protein
VYTYALYTPFDPTWHNELCVACEVSVVLVEGHALGCCAGLIHGPSVCVIYIGVVSVYIQYNCVYYFDTLETARETPRMALAPSLDLLGVPSRSIMIWSITAW